MREATQIGSLFKPSPTDLWKAFRSVHSWPSQLPDIAAESGLTIGKLYTSLARLEDDGLVVLHAESPLEWRLADVA